MNRVRQLSTLATLNVLGLVLAAAGMLLQIVAGSELYPSLSGPIVLVATALFAALGPGGWTRIIGFIVPFLLGVGAIIAAVMTGEFIEQLTDVGNPAILIGSLLHAIGLGVAVVGGAGMLREPHRAMVVER